MKKSRTTRAAGGVFCFSEPGSLVSVFCRWLVIAAAVGAAFLSSASAQTNVKISGYVFDAYDGRPVALAGVIVLGTDHLTQTDRTGFFFLENVPDGRYRLAVEADGYYSQTGEEVEVVADVTRRHDFRLERRVYFLGETDVKGSAKPAIAAQCETIDRRDIRESGARDLARVLDRVEGVYVTETGPAGGPVRVSIRGCDPRHVLVLLDGQRLNGPTGGEADLGTIPLEMVEKVEVFRGGQSARYGPDALGGVINIVTRVQSSGPARKLATGKYWGKWKTEQYRMTAVNPLNLKRMTGRFTYNARATNGDFEYDYRVTSRTGDTTHSGMRQNAPTRNRNYFGTGHYQMNSVSGLDFSGQVYRSERGLPGSVTRPDSTAFKEDKRALAGLRFRHDPSLRYHLEMMAGFSRFEQYFSNLEHERVSERYENRYTNDIFTFQTGHRFLLWTGGELQGGTAIERNILYHDDLYRPSASMGRTVRDNIGLFAAARQSFDLRRIPVLDAAVIDVSLRWDNTDTKIDSTSVNDPARVNHIDDWSKKVSLIISRGRRTRLAIRAGYGTSYQLPTVNALFWKGDVRSRGNPDLRPERSEHSEAGIEISADYAVRVSAGITYYHAYTRDLIVWQQGTLGWQPVNLDAARITGHEDFIRLSLFDERIRFNYQNTVTVAKNRKPGVNSYDKILTYRPHYVTNLEWVLRLWKLQAAYNIRLVDIRYALAANTKWYEAYRIDDVNMRFTTEFRGLTLEMMYLVKNLRAEDYVLIGHYPMPGREWGIEISLAYRL